MDHPFERAKGLLLAGQCLLYKYLTSAPEQEHPWPEKLKDKLSQLKRRRRKRFRQAQEAKAAAEKAAAAGGQAAGEGEGGAGDGGGSSGEGTDGGRVRGSVDGAGDRTSIAGAGGVGGVEEEEDPPLDDEEQAALQQQLALARNLHAQCEDTLHQALQVRERGGARCGGQVWGAGVSGVCGGGQGRGGGRGQRGGGGCESGGVGVGERRGVRVLTGGDDPIWRHTSFP